MERQKESLKIDLNVADLNNYLKMRLCHPYLPKDLVEDWNIFGSVISKVYGPDGVFPKEYKDEELLLWLKDRLKVKALLKYCQWKLFSNYAMLRNKRATDDVLMRIIVSKLNNLNLPRIYADEIFDNVHLQYDVRKPVFEDYFVIKVLGLPFELTETRVCPF